MFHKIREQLLECPYSGPFNDEPYDGQDKPLPFGLHTLGEYIDDGKYDHPTLGRTLFKQDIESIWTNHAPQDTHAKYAAIMRTKFEHIIQLTHF
jgi:hypothetical protein